MIQRDRLILAACVAGALMTVGAVLWPVPVEAPSLPDLSGPAEDTPLAEATAETHPGLVAAAEATASPRSAAPLEPPPPSGDPGEGTGKIYGYLQMSVELMREIGFFTIVVTEDRNENLSDLTEEEPAWTVQRGFAMSGDTTPRFEIGGVPFSSRPYRVRVHVPHYNGSFRLVRVDQHHPVVEEDECVLSVTRGVPFSVRLRDQRFRPVVDTLVRLEPSGRELGLSAFQGETDNYGSIVFEAVLRGSYDVYVGDVSSPYIEPQRVEVMGHTPVYPGKPVTPQGTVLEVPTGQPVQVEAVGPGGYGLEGIQVTLKVVDTTENRRLESVTDHGGIARFPHVIPGSYEVNWIHPEHHRRTRMLRVEQGIPPDPLRVSMIPRR